MSGRVVYKRPYLDATVWTSALDDQEADHADASAILAAADRGELKIVTSTLMELEVLGGPFQGRSADAAKRALSALRSSKYVAVAPSPIIVANARDLRLELNIHSMDAVHVATALYAEADVFLTSDDPLFKRIADKVAVEVEKLYWPGDDLLDLQESET